MAISAFVRAERLLSDCSFRDGRVAEWFKAPVLKTGRGSRLSWVRIPPLPPAMNKKPNIKGLFALAVTSIPKIVQQPCGLAALVRCRARFAIHPAALMIRGTHPRDFSNAPDLSRSWHQRHAARRTLRRYRHCRRLQGNALCVTGGGAPYWNWTFYCTARPPGFELHGSAASREIACLAVERKLGSVADGGGTQRAQYAIVVSRTSTN